MVNSKEFSPHLYAYTNLTIKILDILKICKLDSPGLDIICEYLSYLKSIPINNDNRQTDFIKKITSMHDKINTYFQFLIKNNIVTPNHTHYLKCYIGSFIYNLLTRSEPDELIIEIISVINKEIFFVDIVVLDKLIVFYRPYHNEYIELRK